VDFAGIFAFVEEVEPLVKAAVDAEGRKLELTVADHVCLGEVLVLDADVEFVADVLDIDFKSLIPLGELTRVILHLGLELLLLYQCTGIRNRLSIQ